jgi:hypothetical protein
MEQARQVQVAAETRRPRLTRWFPADVAPVRVGVYQKDFGVREEYQFWDGTRWHYGCSDPQETEAMRGRYDGAPKPRAWRGLTARATGARA